MLPEHIKQQIMDGRFEETELGFFLPQDRLMIRGTVRAQKRGEEEEETCNLIVGEGLNYLIGVATGSVAQIGSWYVAVFSGDVTVQNSWTAANFAATATEVTQYLSATRPAWTPGAVASGARDSFASKAAFQSTADGVVIRGAALVSASGKSSTGGTLMGAARLTTDKTLDTDETLDVGYGLQVSPVA